MARNAAHHIQNVSHVPSAGQRWIRRSLCLSSKRRNASHELLEDLFLLMTSSGESDWKDVRVQEAREEANKKAKRGIYGAHRKANIAADQL